MIVVLIRPHPSFTSSLSGRINCLVGSEKHPKILEGDLTAFSGSEIIKYLDT